MKLETSYGHRNVIDALRKETEALRSTLSDKSTNLIESEDAAKTIERNVENNLKRSLAPSLQSVINATGVIVHTNLGRAPLAKSAIERIAAVAAGYSNLEYNLADGNRGHRTVHASELLMRLTGAEAATVVNNNAAALLLILTAIASGREVIISRGELAEIGGGFRIPDVMRQSGALLREVGTTNRTRPEDYAAAINDNTALILRIHPSNFRIEGFTERPSLRSISKIGHDFGIPVVEDLGGGNLYEADSHGTPFTEPTVQQSLEAGTTICCFSGDKLLGGPQAGLIVGRKIFVRSLSNHPLMRAVRIDKLTYAALEATLLEHLSERADETIPVNRMIKTSIEQLRSRAHEIVSSVTALSKVEVQLTDGPATIGGGAAPGTTIHSCLLHISLFGFTETELEKRLRESNPPVIGRIDHERLLLDLRTVSPDQDQALTKVLVNL